LRSVDGSSRSRYTSTQARTVSTPLVDIRNDR
jgi:hypothetical protein